MLWRQVYKQALIFELDTNKLNKKRNFICEKLLEINKDNKDYFAFRDKVNNN